MYLQFALSSFQTEDTQLEIGEFGNYCSLFIDCNDDEYCDFNNKVGGTCKKRLPEFYPCFYDQHCLTDKCSWRFQCETEPKPKIIINKRLTPVYMLFRKKNKKP